MTTKDDQYPQKWLSVFVDLDNLCARLFWIKIDLKSLPTFNSNKEFVEYLNSCRGDEYVLGDSLDYVNVSYNSGIPYQLGSSAGAVPSGATGSYYADNLIRLTININSKVLGTTAGNVHYPRIVQDSGSTSGVSQWTYWDIDAGTTFTLNGADSRPACGNTIWGLHVLGWRLNTDR